MRKFDMNRDSLERALQPALAALLHLRQDLHRHPEPSNAEVRTAAVVVERLRAAGYAPRTGVGGHGVVADLGDPKAPAVALRVDMDALPIADRKDVPHRSAVPGVMHACGHDFHVTVGVAVAELAARMHAAFGGAHVRFIFQPAEEAAPGGAHAMIAAGALDGVRRIFTVHADPSLPPGRFGVRAGPATAATNRIRIVVHGVGGHSSRPHEAVDAIAAGSNALVALYQIRSREMDALEPVVFNVGTVRGGGAANALASTFEAEGTLRCFGDDKREEAFERIRRVVERTAEAAGARAEVTLRIGEPSLSNDAVLADVVRTTALELFGPSAVAELTRPSMGAEDFANYGKLVPAMLVRVGTARPGPLVPLHSDLFDVDDAAIAPTAILMAAVLARAATEGPPR